MQKDFGKYSIIASIGTGGMAEVFLAKSYGAEGLEKRLVLKRILPEYASRPKFVNMFIDEAKVAVSLNHPNIAQVYEFGKVGSNYYLALEYVDGTDVGRIVSAARRSGRPLRHGDIAYIGVEVAKALDYAHRKEDDYGRPLGIVHRDVSPQNILVSWDGSVKLVDFGIAKARNTANERVGEVKGKMSYMAPEQALGETVDQRSDVFSLGAVLFEALGGRPPFPRGKPEEVLALVRAGVFPSLASLAPEVPPALGEIVMKALAPKPEQRWESARALQVALTRFLFSCQDLHDSATLAEAVGDLRPVIERAAKSAKRKRDDGGAPALGATRAGTAAGDTDTLDTRPEGAALIGSRGRAATQTQTNPATDATGTPSPLELPSFRERRDTFVVCGELIGFGELRSAVSTDRWRAILFDYVHLVQAVAFKNHCGVDRVDERGFLLLAGVPVSSDNDAEAAIRVGRDLLEAVEAMNVNLPVGLRLSVGIGQGALVLERRRHAGEERYEWTQEDESWETAKELARHAQAGEVLADEGARRRTRRSYRFTPIPEDELGPAFRVEGPKSNRERLIERRKSFTTLHGRDFELRLLRQAFQEAKRKNTVQTVVLLGEAGVGKASIVEEFVSGLPADQVHVIRATCGPDSAARPFGPIAEMLEELLGLDNNGDLRALKAQVEDRVAELLEGYDEKEREYILHTVALLYNIKYPVNRIEELDSNHRRARMFLSLRRLLGAASRKGTAVIVVHDVQHSDPSSMEFLTEVVRERRRRPILVALTGRGAPELAQSTWWARLTGGRNVAVHEVGDLPPHAARALTADLFTGPVDPAFVELIVERSGGNPLFIKEIVEHVNEHGLLVERDGVLAPMPGRAELSIPGTVEGIVAGRIGSLPLPAKQVLFRMSIIGREVAEPELGAVFGEVPRDQLDELVRRQVLVEREEAGVRTYRILKGLTRSVAAKGLVAQEREEIHSRLAEYLIDRSCDLTGPETALIAHHLRAANRDEEAGQFYLMAAARALGSAGPAEALALADEALALLEAHSDYRFEALDLRARALKELGLASERRAALQALQDHVDEHGPDENRVRVAIQRARFDFDAGQMGSAEESLRSALELAARIADDRGSARAKGLLASVLRSTGRPEEAWRIADEALALYRDNPEPEGEAHAWNQVGILRHEAGQLDEALAAYRRVTEIAEGAGLRTMQEIAQINIGFCLVKMGELEQAVGVYRQALHEIVQLGQRVNEAALLANLGHAQLRLGDFARAEHSLQRAIRLAKRSDDVLRIADAYLTLAALHLGRGRLDDALKSWTPGWKAAQESQNQYLCCHGLLLSAELKLKRLQRGDLEAALEAADRVIALAGERGHGFARARGESLRARILLRLDRPADAEEAARRAVAALDEGAVEGAEQVYYHHARVMSQLEHPEEARTAIGRAHALYVDLLGRIQSPKARRNFQGLRENRHLVALFEKLAAP